MNIKEAKDIIVYRLENSNKEGPYSYAFDLGENLSDFWQTRPHNKKHGCPTPEEDGFKLYIKKLINNNHTFLFGFTSLKQLNQWFNPQELKALKNHEFKIKKYKAKIAYISSSQVIFIPKKNIFREFKNFLNNF